MELDNVRKNLDNYDNMIKNMLVLRMSLIPIVADIKIKNNLPLFQAKREEEIYKKIENFAKENGIDFELVRNVYKLIIANAIKIEEEISENESNSILNKNIEISNADRITANFEKLNELVSNDIPNIINDIKDDCKKEGLNFNQMATLFFNNNF